MSKRAEQRGLEAVPPRWRKTKDGKGKVDSALPVRKFYIRAYEQAEKDLALTWKDVAILITFYEAGIDNGDYRRYNEAEWMKEYSQDILRRFNEMKEE